MAKEACITDHEWEAWAYNVWKKSLKVEPLQWFFNELK